MALDDGQYTLVAEDAAQDSNSNLIQLEYEVKIVKRFPQTGTQGFSGLPALSPENSFQFNLSGKTEQPELEFILYNDGTDRSNGTLADSQISDSRFSNDTVTTVQEQKIWLKEYIHTANLAVTWRIYGEDWTDRVSTDAGTPIAIKETRPEPVADRPSSMRFIVTFNLGRRVV